ncbi:uncharacterized protein LOC133814858 [Humulus lupulus]|uniref:uncharacterized protein LOC133814858 n=1 Tax=Humulus lupulus TaxID=3486 RepID=UPI002B4070FE|nr:uncharacterized protein LOC133814858 [Humulus lupulus]
MCHSLNISNNFPAINQRERRFTPKVNQAIQEEVQLLLSIGAIEECLYPSWLANPVVVPKKNGKNRVCIDYTKLNKACPKDSYPLPKIDQMIDAMLGYKRMSFLDAYSGYNQILMKIEDRIHTAFTTERGLYCYKVMPFGLKNAKATYQRLMHKIFSSLLVKNMEVYIDDMVVKSRQGVTHVEDLTECFNILDTYQMKLNPAKCVFGVSSGQFLGEDEGQQKLVFYYSKMLLDTKTRYNMMEKLVFALITTKKKLRQYFEGHTIVVYTDYPLKQILSKSDLFGRMSKWAIDLDTYDIRFSPQKVKKGQVLVDFLVEIQSFTPETAPELLNSEKEWMWTMHTDGASNSQRAGIGIVLEAPSGLQIKEAIRLEQHATNNKAKYEALIYGLKLARSMGVKRLRVRGDSKLMIEQVAGNFDTKAPHLANLLENVSTLKSQFQPFELIQIPRELNQKADALAKKASVGEYSSHSSISTTHT